MPHMPRARWVFAGLSTPDTVAADRAMATMRARLGCVFGLALPGDLGCEGGVCVHGLAPFLSRTGLFV